MNQSILRLEGVTKCYSQKCKSLHRTREGFDLSMPIKAVDNAYLEINKGEIFGLLGPNGAGKSTILKMICGLISSTEGKITLDGKEVSIAAYETRQDIGALIELPVFLEKLSGEYNLKYLAGLSGNVTIERIQEMVKLFEMEAYIKQSVNTYSLGMRQKLGVVQAIMNKPKLLILDEPTNGLDPKWVVEVRELLKRLAKEYEITILISSHLLTEMQELCDRVAIMNKGRILSVGSIKDMTELLDDGKEIVEIKVDNIELASKVARDSAVEFSVCADILTVKLPREQLPLFTKELVLNNVMLGGVNVKQHKLEDIFRLVTEKGNEKESEKLLSIFGQDGGGSNE